MRAFESHWSEADARYFLLGAGFCAWLATHAAWASRPRRAAGETQWRQRLKSMVMCSVSARRPARSPPVGPGPPWTIDGLAGSGRSRDAR